jgi:hypothetical protein
MTDRKKTKTRSQGTPLPPDVSREDYIDALGIPRRVLVPEGETDLKMGIPLSLDLSPIFGHMPPAFQRDLYAALHAQGLVEAKDYFVRGAAERFRAAMFTVIAHDFTNVQTLAKEVL